MTLDVDGDYAINIKFGAFIPLSKGQELDWSSPPDPSVDDVRWAPEPGDISTTTDWYFATDNRESAGEAGSSRISSDGTILRSTIGNLNVDGDYFATATGMSHRVQTIQSAFPNTMQSAQAGVTEDEQIANGPTGKSLIAVEASASYPFAMFAPSIDYDVAFTFEKLPNGDTLIHFFGIHDAFPAYELVFNGNVAYSYYAPDPGPSLWNLGWSQVAFSGSVLVRPPLE